MIVTKGPAAAASPIDAPQGRKVYCCRTGPLEMLGFVRIDFDGVTPVPRMLLLSEFQLDSGFQVILDRP
ncbi:hypothetical protein [Streptomyces sp. S1]|uniref:hypothetical protein n=1 Tax=Streptomyces sp. S1 TaxID=718288 RepID=UPI0013CF06DA|nr:hypothetical protein [Streptomyces sp. S1]